MGYFSFGPLLQVHSQWLYSSIAFALAVTRFHSIIPYRKAPYRSLCWLETKQPNSLHILNHIAVLKLQSLICLWAEIHATSAKRNNKLSPRWLLSTTQIQTSFFTVFAIITSTCTNRINSHYYLRLNKHTLHGVLTQCLWMQMQLQVIWTW